MDDMDDIPEPQGGEPVDAGQGAGATPAPGEGAPQDGGAGAGSGAEPDVLDSFSLDGADDGGEPAAAAGGETGATEGGDYKLDFGEGADVPESLAASITAVAREAGADPGKAVKLVLGAQQAAIEYQKGVQREQGKQLKADWGAQFDANMQATKSFMVRVAKQAGIPLEDMAGMATPQGFRLMNACRALVSEGGQKLAGGKTETATLSAEEQLNQIYSDPKKFRALSDPTDPEWHTVNEQVNRLLGLS